jgi:ParB family transcriptional regulator, chromosome partitioning protein
MAKPALGRGLGALLGGEVPAVRAPAPAGPASTPAPSADEAHGGVRRLPLGRIQPSPLQPRKDFPAEALQELADSIREQGIVQPLLVRPRGDGFELIAGERRWRAAQQAGLTEIPAIVRAADDTTVLELMLIENLQREDLNPIEEALGYGQLIDQFQLRQEDVAAKVGRSRAAVANALRLLRLPAEVQAWVRDSRLSVGHAKAILGLTGAAEQRLVAERALKRGLNVRQTEELVSHWADGSVTVSQPGRPGGAARTRDVHVVNLETKLQERFGTKVQVRYRAGQGAVEIRFFTDDDLERILQIVGVELH